MNYIKSYKLFESISKKQEIESDIKDICYDITDDGRFSIKFGDIINKAYNTHDYYVAITLSDHRNYDGFDYSEVQECIKRIMTYLGDRYLACSVLEVGEGSRRSLMEFLEVNGQVNNIYIKYTDGENPFRTRVINPVSESTTIEYSQILEDICQELKDDGYAVSVESFGSTSLSKNKDSSVVILIAKQSTIHKQNGETGIINNRIKCMDIIDYINRMINYMNQNGFKYSLERLDRQLNWDIFNYRDASILSSPAYKISFFL